MDVAALSALQLATFVGRSFVPLEDGSCFAVCAAARYVCCRDLRTFASGLTLDVASLSALQLATSVGRSFVPLHLV